MAKEFKINRVLILIVVCFFVIIQSGYWLDYKINPEHYIFSSPIEANKSLQIVVAGHGLLTQTTWVVTGAELDKALKFHIMQRPIVKIVPVSLKDDFHKNLEIYNQVVMLAIFANLCLTIWQIQKEKKPKQKLQTTVPQLNKE